MHHMSPNILFWKCSDTLCYGMFKVPLGFKTLCVANVMLEEMFIKHVMALMSNKVLLGGNGLANAIHHIRYMTHP